VGAARFDHRGTSLTCPQPWWEQVPKKFLILLTPVLRFHSDTAEVASALLIV
jgi:hypothetical protein